MSSLRTNLGVFARQGLALSVAVSLVLASSPALARTHQNGANWLEPPAPPAPEAAPAPAAPAAEGAPAAAPEPPAAPEAPAAPAQGTGTIALLRFSGDAGAASGLRDIVNTTLQSRGFTVAGIKRDAVEAAKKNKCQLSDEDCIKKLGDYINKNAKTPFDYYGFGLVGAPAATGAAAQTRIVVFDIKGGKKVIDVLATSLPGDEVMPYALGQAVAETLVRSQKPLAELGAEQRAAFENPSDPDKTAEEAEDERQKLAKANEAAKVEAHEEAMGSLSVDLRKDFKSLCRSGPRQDRQTENENGEKSVQRDLRPVCSRGPVFGYFTPRTWITGVVAAGALVGMATFYTLSLVKRGDWRKAQDDLKKSGLSPTEPSGADPGSTSCDTEDCYVQYAGRVSETGERVRKMAIYGDVFLGVTVLMSGVLGLMIWQDRNAARKYLEQEKALKLSNLSLVPVVSPGFRGAAMGFRF